MKKIVYYIAASLLLFSVTKAQNTINLKLALNCTEGAVSITQSTIHEGDTYVIPTDVDIPIGYTTLQKIYDAVKGSEFTIPDGALNQDIEMYMTFDGDCETGLFVPVGGNQVFFNVIYNVFVNGEPVTGEYPLAEGFPAHLKIRKTAAFDSLLTAINITPGTPVTFAFLKDDGSVTTNSIETSITDTTFDAYIHHFSTVVGGPQSIVTAVEDANNNVPLEFALKQNYPNPFNPSTVIEYSVPQKSYVEVNIYNVLGVKVAALVSSEQEAGSYKVNFDASRLTTGVYFYEMKAGKYSLTRKMMYLK